VDNLLDDMKKIVMLPFQRFSVSFRASLRELSREQGQGD